MRLTLQTLLLLITAFAYGTLSAPIPKNTFRPWKINMGTNPDRPMPVPEPANFETIRGTIARPKGVQDLRVNMSPPAGPGVVANKKSEAQEKLREDEGRMKEKAMNVGILNIS